jgi:SAM-dependent methyltransferase
MTESELSPPFGLARCRFCGDPLRLTVIDLGMSPLCERFLDANEIRQMEPFYPLQVFACGRCYLVQLEAFVSPEEIFSEYAYFSSYSTSWIEHARTYVGEIQRRLALGPDDLVVELASNDGYLLRHFVGTGIPILGVDPAANVAEVAVERGVPTMVAFFGRELAEHLVDEGKRASLVVANNVLAQVPDLNDFVAGVSTVLRADGTATFEFPHLARLLDGVQYDTIYHEHFSYFSLAAIVQILDAHELEVYDIQELPTHGGSLRVFAQHRGGPHAVTAGVEALLAQEDAEGLRSPERYARFADDVRESKRALLELLIGLRRNGMQVVGYGAPGKANTLLNYCGIRTDLLDYTVDRNAYKHGLFTPGTHIPIHAPQMIEDTRPDYIVVLPWNLLDEISEQLSYARKWGAKLIVPIPTARIVELTAGRRRVKSHEMSDAGDTVVRHFDR